MNMKLLIPFLAVAGCTMPSFQGVLGLAATSDSAVEAPVEATVQTPAPPPPATATTVAEFDTTTQEEREAAITSVAVQETSLGTTIASLGAPTDPGIWLKTPLVDEISQGRVVYQGNSVNLELRPSGGAVGSGSQLSLAAMRLLEAPLTGLPEVEVFRQ
ncbi:hypothetical protein [Loktanella sp. S4079]|uniref:hypothetical protein n=1 Tax=Loktanella sp. S4079 TaxID=579483 RepID=UPI0005FA03B1|nr:hypothetical protein [Loktanella sp. S4079]KJZ20426.1 D-galactarate dehydratase [Loktanella sp. S4079]